MALYIYSVYRGSIQRKSISLLLPLFIFIILHTVTQYSKTIYIWKLMSYETACTYFSFRDPHLLLFRMKTLSDGCIEGCMEGHIEGCAERCMEGYTERCMEGCIERCMEGCAERCMEGCTERCMEGCIERCMEGCTERCMEGCIERCMEGCAEHLRQYQQFLYGIISHACPQN